MANEDYLNLRLKQFLDAITDKKKVYQLTTDKGFEIEGTLSELKDLITKYDIETRNKFLPQLKNVQEYAVPFELHDIDIYNYLEKTTSNFDPVKTKIVLFDIEVYYNMDFMERITEESYNEYQKNSWEIPKMKNPFPIKIKDKEILEIPDIDKMLRKTHFFERFSIKRAMSLLQEKLERPEKQQSEKPPEDWQHPIFKTRESLKLFENFLAEKNEHYHTDCSFIYRMMHDREKPPLIHEHIKPGMFRNWLNDTNPENEPLTEKLKTWDKMETNNREKTYSGLK